MFDISAVTTKELFPPRHHSSILPKCSESTVSRPGYWLFSWNRGFCKSAVEKQHTWTTGEKHENRAWSANVESEPTAAKGANKKLAGMPHPYLRLPCIKTFLKGTVSDKRLYALYTKQLVLDPAAVASIHRITPSHHASIPSNSRESCKCTP